MSESPRKAVTNRSACTECQRRKQKCNREWPCNHCQKRKVADKCRFGPGQPSPDKVSDQDASRKRQFSREESLEPLDSNPWDDADSGFEALGYTSYHLFTGVGSRTMRESKAAPKTFQQYFLDVVSCPQLERSLQLLSPRPYTDTLVQNFLNKVNYHYYIIYPPSFLEEYRKWWALRSENRPLGLQWTCLLLMVCACSAQFTDIEFQRKLEVDLGESTQKLTEKYHNAARELHSVIPVGNNHFLNVQWLLHSCYWYKSEARFVESWHVLSSAIREAQALGINQETVTGQISEFDREMRRRVWCVLDTWDWQISTLLSRPMIIDRTDCDVGLPSLTLEGYTPSPLLQMKLLSELITQLANRFGLPNNVVKTSDVRAYQGLIKSWMAALPPAYSFNNADKSSDTSRPWIVLHRYHLHTAALSMALDPIRAYLTRQMSKQSQPDELSIRSDGVDYSLTLMHALHGYFELVYPRDAKFHFVLFCIFDTAAVLCSALMHDQDDSIPRRSEILDAVDRAVAMLKRLNTVTKTARTSYDVLVKVAQRISRPPTTTQQPIEAAGKLSKPNELMLTPPSIGHAELAMASDPCSFESRITYTTPPSDPLVYHAPIPESLPTGHYIHDGSAVYAPPTTMPPLLDGSVMMQPEMPMSSNVLGADYPATYVHTTPPTDEFFQAINFGPITEGELGDLASLWNYESLNLNFINPV